MALADRLTPRAQRQRCGLWVAAVAKPAGACLADAELQILHRQTKAVVPARKVDSAWHLVALPEGPCEVTAGLREQQTDKTQTPGVRVNAPKRGQRQAVLRFDS